MAFYRIVRVEGPVPTTGAGTAGRTYFVEDTDTGIVTAYHGEIAEVNQYDTEAWLSYLADEYALTPNDFGLA